MVHDNDQHDKATQGIDKLNTLLRSRSVHNMKCGFHKLCNDESIVYLGT